MDGHVFLTFGLREIGSKMRGLACWGFEYLFPSKVVVESKLSRN